MTAFDFDGYRRLATGIQADLPRLRAVLTAMHLRVVDYVDPLDQAAEALIQASVHGRSRELLRELAKADLLLDEALLVPEIAALWSPMGTLQAMTGAANLPRDALRAFQRGLQACDLVCRIDVDGKAAGTGVLVAPTLVATAAHVIAEVTGVGGDGGLVALAGSRALVTVTFKDHEEDLPGGSRTRLPGEVATLAPDWLAWGSPVAPGDSDLRMDYVEGIHIPEGPWDVAVIRLAERRQLPGWYALETQVPGKPFQVSVLHHPGGGIKGGLPLLVSDGRLESRLGDPPVRLLHSASTGKGSSGAPVFDSDFRLVGFHQAGREAATLAPGEAPVNRAVPVSPLAERIASLLRPLEGRPHPLEVLYAGPADDEAAALTQPGAGPVRTRVVIGRQVAQERLWAGGLPGARPADRLLVVTGEPELGLRFTKRIVQAIASKLGGMASAVDVGNCLNEDADTFAATLVGAFTTAQRDERETGLTTTVRDLRNQTGRAVAQRLNALAGDAGVWLVLEGFQDLAGAVPLELGEVVRDLVANLAQAPQVRLVLVGWSEPLPSGFETSRETLVEPTAHDVAALFCPLDASLQQLDPFVPAIQGLALSYAAVFGDQASPLPHAPLAYAYSVLAASMAARMAAQGQAADGGADG